ncbi:MAG: acyltransferase [Pseudomonadota bacterium]
MTEAATTPKPHRSMDYRPEIDGLRAVAVLAVIFDHAGFAWMPGGFLGVDIFFAISGYLITRILVGELAEDRLSFGRFYERRVRRILPALLLVVLLTIPAAVLLMVPDDLANFGQSVAATILFANNVLLTGTANYFATFSDFKPLIHTWSLGVEEQYYLVVPLFMLMAWRTGGRRAVWIGIVAVTAISFLLCVALAHYHRSPANFFLIFSRAWELGAGSLAALAEPRLRAQAGRRVTAALGLAGLALAVAPLFLFVQQMKLPDWPSAVPVIGACLLLVFAGREGPAGRLLALRPLVGVGLISYSAYLFHQPIFALVAVASLDQPSPTLMAALIVPVLLCAFLSWKFVEQPFRDPKRVSTRTLTITMLGGSGLALAAGLVLAATGGFSASRPDLADAEAGFVRSANVAYNRAPLDYVGVPLPDTAEKPRLLVLGDSFARDFINMGTATHRFDGWAVSFAAPKICKPGPFGPGVLRNVVRADVIVLADRVLPESMACVVRRVALVHAATKAPVIILGTKSFGWANNAPLMLSPAARIAWRAQPLARAVANNAAAKQALAGETYVDMLAMLGDAEGRVPLFTPQGALISWDRQHLTRPGAAYVGEILFRDPAFRVLEPRR